MENVGVLLAKLGIAFLGLSQGIHLMQGWCLVTEGRGLGWDVCHGWAAVSSWTLTCCAGGTC